jgi:hypothetical protein
VYKESTFLDTVSGWWFTDSDQLKQKYPNEEATSAILNNSNSSQDFIEPKNYQINHFNSYISQIAPAYAAFEDAKRKLQLEKPEQKGMLI